MICHQDYRLKTWYCSKVIEMIRSSILCAPCLPPIVHSQFLIHQRNKDSGPVAGADLQKACMKATGRRSICAFQIRAWSQQLQNHFDTSVGYIDYSPQFQATPGNISVAYDTPFPYVPKTHKGTVIVLEAALSQRSVKVSHMQSMENFIPLCFFLNISSGWIQPCVLSQTFSSKEELFVLSDDRKLLIRMLASFTQYLNH